MKNKTLSIIIPVYNEAQYVTNALDQLFQQDFNPWDIDVVVVNDGSTDTTHEKVSQSEHPIRLLRHEHNRGKGAALQTGFAHAHGDAIIVHDADLEYDPSDIPKLLAVLEESGAEAVYGSRELGSARRGYPHYVLGTRMLTWMINKKFDTALTDIYTCYKLMRREVATSLTLESAGFEVEMEITAKLLLHKRNIVEHPIRYTPRSFAEGKKIRARDALRGITTLIKHT